uniref:Polypeptide N-acetylgalactosaminyltransferase 10 n=1 Tax=Cyprinus carpio TaxID=7962 RepID=A0A8C2BHS2_CYPCA
MMSDSVTKAQRMQCVECSNDRVCVGVVQVFTFGWREDIRVGDPLHTKKVCFDAVSHNSPVTLYDCHGMKGNQLWAYRKVRHLYICDFHKNFIQSVRNKRKRKTSDDGGESPDHDVEVPEVDLFQLQVNTLRRYKRHYKIQTRPGLNKAQLAETVSRHFRNIPVNEKETLTYFIYMVKSSKSRLDQKPDASKQVE